VAGSSSSLSSGSSSTSGSCDFPGLLACSESVGEIGLSEHGGGASSSDDDELGNLE
jgi:hypothetical protein